MEELKQRYNALKEKQPNIRVRNAATELGVTECDLVAMQIGDTAVRLIDDAEALLRQIEPMGEVMALTRNEACVHERKGVYQDPKFFRMGKMATGLFVNPDIDLRLFMGHWSYAFAVIEATKTGPRRSIQFFDKAGVAVHKIYMTERSIVSEFDTFVERNKHTEQTADLVFEDYEPGEQDRPDSDIDWSGFRKEWENLKDTHDFFPMLKKFKVGREQAFRKIGRDFAYEVETDAARLVLEKAKENLCDIMVFVGNRGCIQIHTGRVSNLKAYGNWYNVLDLEFNLHLNEEDIARIWVTKKPTEDGHVTAVEVFDHSGELIVTFFGARKPGNPELEMWREIVNQIPAKELSDAA